MADYDKDIMCYCTGFSEIQISKNMIKFTLIFNLSHIRVYYSVGQEPTGIYKLVGSIILF